ncbi:TM2 domain-containing protein [Roseibium sp. RKSG952]|uniref:TM2 domain-containing protein n=1 Tax=Roseibium sp. RKSG952 TaxID=2529384 RepID=UPI0012BC084D|nr:TM2 domain-containing protein [Roseibium sp. RKSG952]MTH96656.1 TM2 domain-containing protein [Roseibium sp. RKSG952]
MSEETQKRILIEQRVTNEAKSMALAYICWFFLGGLGVHRMYLGRALSGLSILALQLLGWVFLINGSALGGFLLIFAWGWIIVDAFLIPGMVNDNKGEVRARLTAEAGL